MEEEESAMDAFERHIENNDALNVHSEKVQKMLTSRDCVQKINEARQAQTLNTRCNTKLVCASVVILNHCTCS